MKILWVISGNLWHGNSPIILNQAKSIEEFDHKIKIEFFLIKGKGVLGYLKSIPSLRQAIKNYKPDLAHAHYGFSAFAASLAGVRPLVVSLMGSDAHQSCLWRFVAKFFYYLCWNLTIVKSQKMKELLRMDDAYVIPNGVDLETYKPMPQIVAKEHIGYSGSKKLIIFVADPTRSEKNFVLAKKSVSNLERDDVELMPVFNVPNAEIPYYLNAADVLLLTSKAEGSPNVVKEAMACNCPIVSTDVGDVKWVFGDTEGCFLTSFKIEDMTEKLKIALEFAKKKDRTKGREQIIKLGLDSETVAKKIVNVYEQVA